jgi:hypothetical protein
MHGTELNRQVSLFLINYSFRDVVRVQSRDVVFLKTSVAQRIGAIGFLESMGNTGSGLPRSCLQSGMPKSV